MEIKVKAVEDSGEKSTQQVEQELLDKHEKSLETQETTPEPVSVKEVKEDVPITQEVKTELKEEEKPVLEKTGLSEDEVLSHINERYNKNIESVDDLFAAQETQEELPEDVASYLKYKKETGRGIEDYVRLNQNFDDMEPDNLLRKYFKETEEGLDDEDIDFKMEEFDGDEDLDEPADIKRKKIAKKKVIAKAKKYFTELKDKYNKPLESSGDVISTSDSKDYQEYKQYLKDAKTYEEETTKKRSWFDKKTNEVFSSEFKGFEFTLDDKRVIFSPGNASELKSAQSSPMNFVKKYLDESGLIKDAKGYHRALAIAMNPDRFAEFFYEQGKSNATEDVMRKTKNINMSERRTPESTQKGGMKFKSISPSSGKGLKIRSIKRK
jgi:hypothetical protein